MKAFCHAVAISILAFSFVGCASKQGDTPYRRSSGVDSHIIIIPGANIGFVPEVISGDGKTVIGLAFPDEGLWKWTKNGGLHKLTGAPQGTQTFAAASDYTGDVVIGSLLGSSGHLSGLFRYTAASGLQLLATGQAPSGLELSEDGQSIIFSCPRDSATYPTCPGSQSSPLNWPSSERLWTVRRGFEILGRNLKEPFDYISSAGNFTSYFLGRDETLPTPAAVGRLDANGHYTAFEGIPENFNLANGWMISNSEMTLAAYQDVSGTQVVWNAFGKSLVLPLPQGCTSLPVSAIDDSGAMFALGLGRCAAYNAPTGIGLRITSAGAQTISAWLEKSGIQNSLAPNTSIFAVSDDGKTVLGVTNVQPPIAMGYNSTLTPKIVPAVATAATSELSSPYWFVAHLP